MSSRTSSLLALLLCLPACSVERGEDDGVPASGEAGLPVGMPVAAKVVPCALAGAKEFKQDCVVERFERDGKRHVVVRHPDGGFRRLIELEGGKRFAADDGAEPAEITPNGQDIEVTVGDDHYLFPVPAAANAPGS